MGGRFVFSRILPKKFIDRRRIVKRTVTKFVCDQRQFEEARGRDGENIRAWIRLLCTGDVDAKAPFPGKPLSTSYLVTGDTRKDRAARRAAARRLLKKAAPCFARKPTLKDLYDRFFPIFSATHPGGSRYPAAGTTKPSAKTQEWRNGIS